MLPDGPSVSRIFCFISNFPTIIAALFQCTISFNTLFHLILALVYYYHGEKLYFCVLARQIMPYNRLHERENKQTAEFSVTVQKVQVIKVQGPQRGTLEDAKYIQSIKEVRSRVSYQH